MLLKCSILCFFHVTCFSYFGSYRLSGQYGGTCYWIWCETNCDATYKRWQLSNTSSVFQGSLWHALWSVKSYRCSLGVNKKDTTQCNVPILSFFYQVIFINQESKLVVEASKNVEIQKSVSLGRLQKCCQTFSADQINLKQVLLCGAWKSKM